MGAAGHHRNEQPIDINAQYKAQLDKVNKVKEKAERERVSKETIRRVEKKS